MNDYKCPKCGKTILTKNNEDAIYGQGIILKSRLVFIGDDGCVMARCLECKTILNLPVNLNIKNNLQK